MGSLVQNIVHLWKTGSLLCSVIIFFYACGVAPKSSSQQESPVKQQVPYYNTADFTPVWIDDPADVKTKITHRIPGFSLTNQDGKTFTEKDLQGKIHVANFFFTTCPSVCPKMNMQVKKIQEAFAGNNDVLLLSFSVIPREDNVAQLKSYAEENGVISGKWHLLTGSEEEIYALARRSYFAELTEGLSKSSDFLHTENVLLVDGNLHLRGIYKGTSATDIGRCIDDIKLLLAE